MPQKHYLAPSSSAKQLVCVVGQSLRESLAKNHNKLLIAAAPLESGWDFRKGNPSGWDLHGKPFSPPPPLQDNAGEDLCLGVNGFPPLAVDLCLFSAAAVVLFSWGGVLKYQARRGCQVPNGTKHQRNHSPQA